MATLVVPHPVPSPREDAEKLQSAVKGFGTNEKAIISILAHRNAAQRNQIRQAYQELFNEDLIKRLESELKGDFEKAVYRWMHEPMDRDAILAHVALKNLKQNYHVIVEIATELSPEELLGVKRAYQCRYKSSLEEDVAAHSTGDLRKILVALLGIYRYDGHEVNATTASSEAKILHTAIEGKAFNHEDLIRILTTRSKAQLNATFNSYRDSHGASITKKLTGEQADGFVGALHTAVRIIINPAKYYEKLIRKAIDKTGTDEDALTRVVVGHAERNLAAIKDMYFKRNSVALDQALAKETSGDYKAFLLALLGCEGH